MSIGQGATINNYQRPIDLIEIANRGKAPEKSQASGQTSFKEMFSRELADNRDVAFSKHASQRLYSRGIEVSEEKLNDVADAIDKAELKGSRETLILDEDVAYVVSVKNRMVVTVFDRDNLRDGIVTSIDSAVII